MAEGETVGQVPEETQNEPEECPICYSEFTDPRLLDCSHTFCLKCLQELKQAQDRDGKNFACPVCRKQTDLPEDEVDRLQKSHQSERDTSLGKLPVDGQGSKVMCQSCEEENEAISRCMDCEHFLCQECEKAHLRLAALRTHKIVALAELDSLDKLKDSIPKCEKHPDQDLCLYCNSCDVPICNTCTTSEHKKPIHFYESIDQAFSTCTQEINEMMHKVQDCINKFISMNQYSIEHSHYRLDTMLRKTKIQITLKAEEEIAKIREKEKKLKREAEDIVSKRHQEFEYATTTKQNLSKVNKVISTGNCYKVLKHKQKLLHDLEDQVDKYKTLNINYKMSFLGFQENQDSVELGTLLLEENWKENSEFGVVTQKYARMKMNDQHIALEGHEVKIFNKQQKLFHKFEPGQELNSKPTCLAVGDDKMIAVGYKDKEIVSLHNPDGSLIKTLPAPLIDKHLTLSNQHIIYTNASHKKLISIDINGTIVFSTDTKYPDYMMYGLCCDGAGDIYVAFYSQSFHHIQHYNAHGKYIASWSKYKSGCYTPSCISFTPEGRLQAFVRK